MFDSESKMFQAKYSLSIKLVLQGILFYFHHGHFFINFKTFEYRHINPLKASMKKTYYTDDERKWQFFRKIQESLK